MESVHHTLLNYGIGTSFSTGDEIVRACDQYSNETVTIGKHVNQYVKMNGRISQKI